MAPKASSVSRQDRAGTRARLSAGRKCKDTIGETTTIWSWSLVFYFPTKSQNKELCLWTHRFGYG